MMNLAEGKTVEEVNPGLEPNKLQEIVRALLITLVVTNAALLLYPRQMWGVEAVDGALKILSSYISPLLVAAMVTMSLMVNRRLMLDQHSLFAIVLCVVVYLASAISNGITLKSTAVALYFGLTAYILQSAWKPWPHMASKFVSSFICALCVWCIAALALLVTPYELALVNTSEGYSFHGFADSRIMFGLWSGVLVILLLTEGRFRSGVWACLLMAIVLGVLLSRSRSAVVGVALASLYAYFIRTGFSRVAVLYGLACAGLITALFLVWANLGRFDAMQVFNANRMIIFDTYIEHIRGHNSVREILLGQARQVSVPFPGAEVTQAHNLLLQWFVNWGALGLGGLLLFLGAYWRWLRSVSSRMIFILLAVFSLMLPIQGTENFFSPVTLMLFLLMSAIEAKTRE